MPWRACKPRSVRRRRRFTIPRDGHPAANACAVISLGCDVSVELEQPTRGSGVRAAPRSPGELAPAWPCSGWGLPGRGIAADAGGLLHLRFTLARAPSAHERFFSVARSAGFPARVLPGTLPLGARTFLRRPKPPATARPALTT